MNDRASGLFATRSEVPVHRVQGAALLDSSRVVPWRAIEIPQEDVMSQIGMLDGWWKWALRSVCRGFVVALPTLQLLLYFSLEMPVLMVKVGALAQSLMLPVLAFAILQVRRRRLDPRLSPSRLVDVLLVGACVVIAEVALYGIIAKLNGGP